MNKERKQLLEKWLKEMKEAEVSEDILFKVDERGNEVCPKCGSTFINVDVEDVACCDIEPKYYVWYCPNCGFSGDIVW